MLPRLAALALVLGVLPLPLSSTQVRGHRRGWGEMMPSRSQGQGELRRQGTAVPGGGGLEPKAKDVIIFNI